MSKFSWVGVISILLTILLTTFRLISSTIWIPVKDIPIFLSLKAEIRDSKEDVVTASSSSNKKTMSFVVSLIPKFLA